MYKAERVSHLDVEVIPGTAACNEQLRAVLELLGCSTEARPKA